MTATQDQTARNLLNMGGRGVGASTGYMESRRGHWSLLVDLATTVSSDVVELSALSAMELPDLLAFLSNHPSLGFGYVSVHGPAKGWCGRWDELAHELDSGLPAYVSFVVMHPETLGDVEAFRALGSKLILENMDPRKPDGRTVDELDPYFAALPDAGFCFDIAHAYMNDRSMRLAHQLLDAYGDRLREVHISSTLDDGTHVPLRPTDVRRYWPVLDRCKHVPWVLEAEPPRT